MSRITIAQLKGMRRDFQEQQQTYKDALRQVKYTIKVIDELIEWKKEEEGDDNK